MALSQARREELRVVRGDSVTIRVTVLDENGNTVDITSGTVHFRVKLRVGVQNVEILKSSAEVTEIVILPQGTGVATNGQADIILNPADTAGLKKGTHVYDIWIEDVPNTGDDNVVIAPSPFIVEPAVTILSAPAPPAPGAPGPSILGAYERGFAFVVPEGTNSALVNTGPATVGGSLLGISAFLTEAVTAGTVTLTVVIGGVDTPIVIVLDDTTNPSKNGISQTFGIDAIASLDDIDVRIDAAGYANGASATSGIVVNVLLST